VAWRGRRGAWRARHDREVRVLATPLDPAGRIRGDVIASSQMFVCSATVLATSRGQGHGIHRRVLEAIFERVLGERLQFSWRSA
jgi:hypothetical protein